MQRVLTFQDIAFGDAEKIKDLFLSENEANQIIYINGNNVTPLYIAVEFGRMDMVRVLLKHGAKTNVSSSDGVTTLLKAIRYDVDKEESKQEEGLGLQLRMSYQNLVEMVHVLLSAKDTVEVINRHDDMGRYALLDATSKNYLEIVRMLLSHGANIHVVDDKKFTSLMLATQNGCLPITMLLLDAGAKINATNVNDHTALLMAGMCGQLEVVDELLFRGAELNVDLLSVSLDNMIEYDNDVMTFIDMYYECKTAKEEYFDVKEQINSFFLGEIKDEQANPAKTISRFTPKFFLPARIVEVIEEYASPTMRQLAT